MARKVDRGWRMSLHRTLDAMAAALERAAGVPLTASCLLNRSELLALVDEARASLPVELEESAMLLAQRQDLLAQAERAAREVLAEGRRRADDEVESSSVVARAQLRAEQILDAARTEAARLLREADDYCDRRLGEFETDLQRTMRQVRRGRDRLRERSGLDGVPDPSMSSDGATDSLAGGPTGGRNGGTGGHPAAGSDRAADQAGDGHRLIDLTAVEQRARLG